MRTSRRVSTALLSAVALSATLAACGSDDSSDDTATGTGGTFPVTVDHKCGSTTIDADPERVVTVGFNDLDYVLALGETPVATRAFTGYDYKQRPWAEGYATDIPEVGGMTLDFEKIAEANPDVLLGTYSVMTQNDYDTLTALAPTVADAVPAGGAATASWTDQLATVGAAIGREQEAAEVEESVRGAFTAATDANPQFAGRTIAVAMDMGDGSYYILEASDPRAAYFTELGFTITPQTGSVSAERLDLLDQQTLVILGATKEQLAANPAFAQLAAVREDRTVYLGEFGSDVPAALGFASPLSLPYLLDATVPALSAATDDDAATVVPAVG